VKQQYPRPASALVIAAHPDDAEFQCGATLAKWAEGGTVVHYLVCTDGSKGTWDAGMNQSDLVNIRIEEQTRAARKLGATGEILFLGETDGELDSTLINREKVAKVIRELKPEVVLGHDPWKRYRLHPDHRHAGLLAVEGIVAARDPFFFPEQLLEPHRPSALFLFEAEEPNHAEEVGHWAQSKSDALLEHQSQFVTTHGISDPLDPAQIQDFNSRIHQELERNGTNSGLAHAELFRILGDL